LRRKISVPTLLIWGTNDGFLEKKLAEVSSRLVEQCSVHYIEGASHWVQQEEHEQFNLLMRQFLNNEL
jgi:pimeloyl-ACP methyl ester carboxylesterase